MQVNCYQNEQEFQEQQISWISFLVLNTFDSTVLSPNLPAVSNAILVISARPFLNLKIGPGSNIKLLTLLGPPFDEVITGVRSKLKPNLSLYKILIPVAHPIVKLFEKFQVVALVLVETKGYEEKKYIPLV